MKTYRLIPVLRGGVQIQGISAESASQIFFGELFSYDREGSHAFLELHAVVPVSYTHLTLPTILLV